MANKQLDDLMKMIDRKVSKELSKLIIKIAMANGVSVKYIEKNHADLVERHRTNFFEAEKEKHKDELEKLSDVNYKAPKQELQIEAVEVVEVEAVKESTKESKPKKKTKSEFGFYQDEIDFMIQEYVYGNKGCKTIARIMERDEKKVRKQIALTVSEICA